MIEFLLTTAGCLLGFSHIATTPRTEMKMNETGETKMAVTVFNSTSCESNSKYL